MNMAGNVPDLDLSTSELYNSSSESHSTNSDTTVLIRNDLRHFLDDFNLGFDPPRQPALTEQFKAALDMEYARGYQHDIPGWISGQDTMPAAIFAQENAALVSELNQSMMLAERSTTSSRSHTIGSSWCLVDVDAAKLNTTDQHVYATGGQFDNEAASPLSIDEILM